MSKRIQAVMSVDKDGKSTINDELASRDQVVELLSSGGYWHRGKYHGTIEDKQEQATPKNKR